jgi:hypothetical protein
VTRAQYSGRKEGDMPLEDLAQESATDNAGIDEGSVENEGQASGNEQKQDASQDVTAGKGQSATPRQKPVFDTDYWKQQYFKEKRKRQEFQRGQAQQPAREATPDYSKPSKPFEQMTVDEYTDFIQKSLMQKIKGEIQPELAHTHTQQKLEIAEEKARSRHDGKDGLPSYDELIDEYLMPQLEDDEALFMLIKQTKDPAETAYRLALLNAMPDLMAQTKAQGREEMIDKIEDVAKRATTVKKGNKENVRSSSKLSASDIMKMPNDKFEDLIAQTKNQPRPNSE